MGTSSTPAMQQRCSADGGVLQPIPHHRSMNRFARHVIDLLTVAEALTASPFTYYTHVDLAARNIMIDNAVALVAAPVPEWCVCAAVECACASGL